MIFHWIYSDGDHKLEYLFSKYSENRTNGLFILHMVIV
ncbi:hypothetical protein M997_0975 [Proteus hauseri ATCC 700826]|uniref:Uncharacterized protein n=1 Tax=Proteus hauseri ATCC 700826 TaxID=1354271 RepID=A0AAJ3HU41_PROHU|nr:hypothetical protein M997_0975 [Proteus hauseri ATCC 700826]